MNNDAIGKKEDGEDEDEEEEDGKEEEEEGAGMITKLFHQVMKSC